MKEKKKYVLFRLIKIGIKVWESVGFLNGNVCIL